jgi:hypothetical protein
MIFVISGLTICGSSNNSKGRSTDGHLLFDVLRMITAEFYSVPHLTSRSMAQVNSWFNDSLKKYVKQIKIGGDS